MGAPLWPEIGQLPNQLLLPLSQSWPREGRAGAAPHSSTTGLGSVAPRHGSLTDLEDVWADAAAAPTPGTEALYVSSRTCPRRTLTLHPPRSRLPLTLLHDPPSHSLSQVPHRYVPVAWWPSPATPREVEVLKVRAPPGHRLHVAPTRHFPRLLYSFQAGCRTLELHQHPAQGSWVISKFGDQHPSTPPSPPPPWPPIQLA